MTWPVVLAAGGPRERGRAYGSQASERVHRSIEVYERVFAHYARLPWAEVRRRAALFVQAIDAYDVQLLPELEGIAEGAGVEAEDVLAINLRTEIMFGLDARPAQASAKSPPRECTAIGRSLDDGRVWIAQTWDWKPAVRDNCVVLVCAPHDRPGFVTLVEAGLWAKCGANEAGIGLATNALESSLDVGAPGVPFHAVLRRVLTSGTIDEAIDAVTRGPRASSANYLVGHRGGRVVNLETAPGGPSDVFAQEASALVHANHFIRPAPPFEDLGLIDGEDSLHRHATAAAAVTQVDSPHALRSTLGSHEDPSGSICVHGDEPLDPVEDYVTIAGVLADLTRGTLAVTHGNPCRAAFEEHQIGELLARARATGALPPSETLVPGHPPG